MTSGTKIRLVMDDLTLGDLDDFESYTGESLTDTLRERVVIDPETGKPVLGERGRPVKEVQLNMKALIGIVWIVGRSTDPDYTIEDARKTKITELEIEEPTVETRADREAKKDDALD